MERCLFFLQGADGPLLDGLIHGPWSNYLWPKGVSKVGLEGLDPSWVFRSSYLTISSLQLDLRSWKLE
ncbi:hypothetical protein Tco_1115500 [Tanacetum coccineum]